MANLEKGRDGELKARSALSINLRHRRQKRYLVSTLTVAIIREYSAFTATDIVFRTRATRATRQPAHPDRVSGGVPGSRESARRTGGSRSLANSTDGHAHAVRTPSPALPHRRDPPLPFEPDVAAIEVLALQIGTILFSPLDHVPARRERISSMTVMPQQYDAGRRRSRDGQSVTRRHTALGQRPFASSTIAGTREWPAGSYASY